MNVNGTVSSRRLMISWFEATMIVKVDIDPLFEVKFTFLKG